MKAFRFTAPILFGLLACLGCASSSPAAEGKSATVVIGTNDAQAVSGSARPVLLPSIGGCAMTGLPGTITFTAATRFSAPYSYREQCPAFTRVVNLAIGGRHTRNDNGLVFAPDSGFSKFASAGLINATLSGPIMTVQGTAPTGGAVTMTARSR